MELVVDVENTGSVKFRQIKINNLKLKQLFLLN